MGATLMVKEKCTRTCYYLLLIYEPQSIIHIPHASLFNIEWWVTFIQLQNLVQCRNTFSIPFYNRFHIIRGFDCTTELWVPFSVMISTSSMHGVQRLHTLYNHSSNRNLRIKFNDFSMTFQGPFLISNGRNYPEKNSNEMHNDLSSFYVSTSYMRFTMSMTQFINKTHVEGMQTICLFPYCYLFKDRCQKTHGNHIRKISNFFKLIFFTDFSLIFNDFSRQNVIFPGQHQIPWLFKARLKFHDFSRLVWTMYNIMMKLTIIKNSSKVLKLHNKRIFEWAYMQEETLWHGRNDENKTYKSFQSYRDNNW